MISKYRHEITTALLLMTLLLGAFLRFHRIIELPPGLYPDEAANGNNALEALRTGNFKIFYPENNGREGLFINLQAFALAIFDPAPWVLRAVSALFGTFTILSVYLLARELFPLPAESGAAAPPAALDRRTGRVPERSEDERGGRVGSKFSLGILNAPAGAAVPLLAAFFLATSFWHLNFSRISFRAILVPFLSTLALWWLLVAIRTGKLSSAIAGGAAFGLGFHTYIAFRFMPFVITMPMLLAFRNWRHGRAAGQCTPCLLGVFLFVAFLVALPIGLYFLDHPADFFGRGGQVSIFSGESPAYEFAKSNVLTLGMFHVHGDCNLRHNLDCRPELALPVGIAFLAGLGLAVSTLIRRGAPQRTTAATLLGWLAVMTLPATLTREGLPHALRAIGMIPPVMLITAWGAAWLWEAAAGFFDRLARDPDFRPFASHIRRIRKELLVIALAVLVWTAHLAYRDYFIRFAPGPEAEQAFAADLWRQGQYLASLPDAVEKFVIVNLAGEDIRGVPAPAQTIMFATDTFDPGRRAAKRFHYVRQIEDIRIDRGVRVAIMPMNGRDRAVRAAIRERLPWLEQAVPRDFLIFYNFDAGGR